ncbi:FAT domain-containing protein, partial [Trichostrongylus colubriformis]
MFSHLFHSLWISMSEEERNFIGGLAVPFMSAGALVQQAHAVHPVINILLETFSHCNPPIPIDANSTQFLTRFYHSWHRGILLLENRALCIPPMLNNASSLQPSPDSIMQENLDVLTCLELLYSELAEQDQFAAVWNRRALTVDSVKILAMQQLGDIEEALDFAQSTARSMLHRIENHFGYAFSDANFREFDFIDNAYLQCTKELCRWKVVCDIAKSSHVENPELLFEAAVHLPDWTLAKQCRDQIMGCTRHDFAIQNLTYSAMLGILVRV